MSRWTTAPAHAASRSICESTRSSPPTGSSTPRWVASSRQHDAPPEETDFNGGTSNEEVALVDEGSGQPVSNGVRNLWVTETALASALNLAYTAEQISLFGIVVGVALLLAGIGFAILAVAALHRRTSTQTQD